MRRRSLRCTAATARVLGLQGALAARSSRGARGLLLLLLPPALLLLLLVVGEAASAAALGASGSLHAAAAGRSATAGGAAPACPAAAAAVLPCWRAVDDVGVVVHAGMRLLALESGTCSTAAGRLMPNQPASQKSVPSLCAPHGSLSPSASAPAGRQLVAVSNVAVPQLRLVAAVPAAQVLHHCSFHDKGAVTMICNKAAATSVAQCTSTAFDHA